ncbi:uncharacterized protein LOC126659722 [Mercurialis annua]|uniref:uncharacterized protein LOC126659722 n=1 Tax=Mercurialis annua TaxID=3986 RepID=UPI00215F1E32|nr:uncharacterized protein LOC126659722 [Mercurialis annua]XP_055960210.1 uncharacterized protein LOC126659722 [Mercurialis annua]
MGLEGSLQSLQNLHLPLPNSQFSCRRSVTGAPFCISSLPRRKINRSFSYSFIRTPTLFSSSDNLKTSGLKRSCSVDSNEYFNQEFLREIEDFSQKFDVFDDYNTNITDSGYVASKIDHKIKKTDSSMSFLPSKLEFLEPSFLGILPEPPEWPEREEIVKMGIQLKANSVDIPLSLRMIGKKQKCELGFVDETEEFAYCAMDKAFSSMVLMIRELQNHALSIRANLYSEDLTAVISKFHKEMNASFVWLFQQVFSRTPTLMIYVMLLLANFTLHSMDGNMATGLTIPVPIHTITIEESGKENSGLIRLPSPSVGFLGDQEMSEEEEELELWNMVVQEAKLMQEEESGFSILDRETTNGFVSPVSVEIEAEDYVEFYRTDLVYQMGIAENPGNTLLLSNYAHFLYKVRHDYNRAEECFKRAIMSGPPDAETFSRYADFLWLVRNDLWNAEEVYLQAVEADPENHYYMSKYANFLWNTGAEDTCFPLSASPPPPHKVM